MRMPRLLIICSIVSAFTTSSLAAQAAAEPAQLPPLIRLTPARSGKPLVGTPVSMDRNTTRLVLRGTVDTVAVSMASLRKIERSTGRRGSLRRARTGAIIGGTILGVFGLAGGAAQNSDAVSVPAGLLAGATAGALIGGLMGGAVADENSWVEAPLLR